MQLFPRPPRPARAVPFAVMMALGAGLACGSSGLGAEGTGADVLTAAEREQFFERYFERMTAAKPLGRFQRKEQWLAYRAQLREKVLRAIGLSPLPERVPLEPKISGRLEREGYTVDRVYYQVFRGVYARAICIGRGPNRARAMRAWRRCSIRTGIGRWARSTRRCRCGASPWP